MKICYSILSTLFLVGISTSLWAQPANDQACNAILLTVDDIPFAASNVDATVQLGEVEPPMGNCANAWCDGFPPENTVWFTFQAPANGAVVVSTCSAGTNIDTQAALWSVEDCSDFSTYTYLGACDDMQGGCDNGNQYASYISLDGLVPGATYYIQIDGFAAEMGDFEILAETGTPTSLVNFIHNSADQALPLVDVWMDGELVKDNLAFRTSTGYLEFTSGTDHLFAICDAGSTDDSDPLYSETLNFDGSQNYILATYGFVSDSGYDPLIPFTVVLWDDAHLVADDPSNSEFLLFSGATDGQTYDVSLEEWSATPVLDNIQTGTFQGYAAFLPDIYTLLLEDMNGGDLGLTYCAPFSLIGGQGSAVTLITSGFVDPSMNSDGAEFGLFFINPFNGAFVELNTGACPIPPNDGVCDAIELIVDAPPASFSNSYASSQEGEVNPPNLPLNDPEADCINQWCDGSPVQNSVWFYFTAPPTGTVGVSTCFDITFDTQLAVWKAGDCSDFSSFILKGNNDDADGGCGAGDLYASAFIVGLLIPGEVYYIQLDGWGGSNGDFEIQVTEMPTDISENNSSEFSIYPNPADDSVVIIAGERGTQRIRIVNQAAQVVLDETFNLQTELDLSKLASGVYSVQVTGLGKNSVRRLVVN